MRLPTLLTTTTSLLTSLLLTTTTARITGFSAPSTIVPGSPIQIHLHAENYVQSVQDVAIAFGIAPSNETHPGSGSIGTFVGEKFLGPENSNIIANITANLSIPTSRPLGNATLTAALFSLYGVGLTGSLEYFAVNVTVGNETSGEYVVSEYDGPVEARWRA